MRFVLALLVAAALGRFHGVAWAQSAPCASISCTAAATSTTKKNILLMIADDLGYCHLGFMQGLCTTPIAPATTCVSDEQCNSVSTPFFPFSCVAGRCIKACTSNRACSPGERCVGSSEFNALRAAGQEGLTVANSKDAPLRRNDLACRNRQAKALSKNAPYCTGDVQGGLDISEELPLDRRFSPCVGTPSGAPFSASRPAGQVEDDPDPAVRTPYVDGLAMESAVFPRSYGGAPACKNSRPIIQLGMHHRHLARWDDDLNGVSWVAKPKQGSPSCVTAADGKRRAIPCFLGPHTGPEPYRRAIYGKSDSVNESQGGYEYGATGADPPLGGLSECDATCEQALANGNVAGVTIADMDKVFGEIDKTVTSGASPAQIAPFFITYAPNIPHENGPTPDYLRRKFGKKASLVSEIFPRVTLFDYGVGRLLKHLDSQCVCEGTTARPIRDRTVVIMIADNGFLLPRSRQNPTDAGERTSIIVNHPRHRGVGGSTIAPHVFEEDLDHAVDLLRTIVDVAGGGTGIPGFYPAGLTPTPLPYPYGKDLMSWIENPPANPSENPVRRVVYSQGQQSQDLIDPKLERVRWLLTRPGEVGVCQPASELATDAARFQTGPMAGHLKPCVNDDDCPGASCALAGKKCANRPWTLCSTDADCGAELCVAGACNYRGCRVDQDCGPGVDCVCSSGSPPCTTGGLCTKVQTSCSASAPCADGLQCKHNVCKGVDETAMHSFADFSFGSGNAPVACTTSGQDDDAKCVPKGVCQAPVIKAMGTAAPESQGSAEVIVSLTAIYDKSWDPDENTALPGTYLGPKIGLRVQRCLERFNRINTNTKAWEPKATGEGCAPWSD